MRISAVILAAGAGMRLGGVAKALLAGKNQQTFLTSILLSARAVGLHEAIVVVGPPYGAEVGAHAAELGASVVVNPQPERGMASSIASGFAALGDPAQRSRAVVDAAWLWPVDHPDVDPATLRTLIAALGTHAAARPVYDKRGGHPPLIASSLFTSLATCSTIEGGARSVLAAADTIEVPVDDPGCVRDIDTAIDLEAL